MQKSMKQFKAKQGRKSTKLTLVVIVTAMALSSVALTISGAGASIASKISNRVQLEINEEMVSDITKQFTVNKEEALQLKAELGDWDKVEDHLMRAGRYIGGLPQVRIDELYNQGYAANDIYEAQVLAQETKKNVEELLEMKGKADSGNTQNWDDIRMGLGAEESKPAHERLGMTKEKYDELLSQGLNPVQINQLYAPVKEKYDKLLALGFSPAQIDDVYISEKAKYDELLVQGVDPVQIDEIYAFAGKIYYELLEQGVKTAQVDEMYIFVKENYGELSNEGISLAQTYKIFTYATEKFDELSNQGVKPTQVGKIFISAKKRYSELLEQGVKPEQIKQISVSTKLKYDKLLAQDFKPEQINQIYVFEKEKFYAENAVREARKY